MPFNINELPLRRCVYNGNEVKTVKVRYGDISGTKYAGLTVDVSYLVRKTISVNSFASPITWYKFHTMHTDTMSVIFSSANNELHKIKKLSLSGHVYSKSEDDTFFYDKYFSYTDITSDTFELNAYGTEQEISISEILGHIVVATYIDLDYIITYDDNNTYSGKYNNYIYDEYNVNTNDECAFGGTFNIYAEKEYLEKVVWTRDPALITRPKVNIGFENVRFRETVTYVGETCGSSIYEYYYYSDLTPNFFIEDDGTVKSDEVTGIEEISLHAYIDMRVYANGTYIIRETAFTTMTVKGTSGKFTPNLKFNGDTLSSEATRCDVRIAGNATIKYKDGYSRTINLIPQYEVYYWNRDYALDRTINLTFLKGV